MKLLLLAGEYAEGEGHYGEARYTQELAKALAELDTQFQVLVAQAARQTETSPGPVIYCDELSVKSFHWVSQGVLDNLPLLEKAGILLQNQQFDAILASTWSTFLTAKMLKTISGLPLVVTLNNIASNLETLSPEEKYREELKLWIAQEADAILTFSEISKSNIRRFYKVPRGKIHCHPLSISTEHLISHCHLPDFRSLFASPEQKIVLYVGRFTQERGGKILLQAAKKIFQQHPETVVVMVGEGPQLEEFQKQAGQKFPEFSRFCSFSFSARVSSTISTLWFFFASA